MHSPDPISPELLLEYNNSRSITNKPYFCHAPFNNMYFNSLGHIAPCWLTFQDPEIYTPDKSILEIWRSEKFTNLRTAIKNHHLSYRCNTCLENLQNGNYTNILSKAYDNNYPLSDYPTIMEFELTNTCNLECVMCTGMLSSSIRKNRDHLPPLPNPYGDKFVEDLKQMIPHLHEARFNGGEPFLIKLYYPIWDHIIAINPNVKIVIATNGTVINERVRHYIQKGNIHLNISIDGLTEQTYNAIRINGKIEQVLSHFEEFRQLCTQYQRTICIMINPMRSNWWEMPDFVNFCNQNHVHLWFNTIERPLDHALWNLPATELQKIYEQLHSAQFTNRHQTPDWLFNYNVSTYRNLVQKQIGSWYNEALQREQAGKQYRFETDATHSLAMQELYFAANKHVKDFALMKEQIVRIHHRLETIHQMEQSGALHAGIIQALTRVSPLQLIQFLHADENISHQSIGALLAC